MFTVGGEKNEVNKRAKRAVAVIVREIFTRRLTKIIIIVIMRASLSLCRAAFEFVRRRTSACILGVRENGKTSTMKLAYNTL